MIFGFLDYKSKRLGLGDSLVLSGDVEKDLDVIRRFYKPLVGRRPKLASPIKFPPSA